MHTPYHRLWQSISSYTSPIIITCYIVYITYHMPRLHITYIVRYVMNVTPYVSYSTYYLSPLTDPRLHIANLWSFHVTFQKSRVTYTLYAFPASPFDIYIISNVVHNMLSLALARYLSDNPIPLTYHRLC